MDLIAEKAESLCGYRPAAEDVEEFLVTLHESNTGQVTSPHNKHQSRRESETTTKPPVSERGVKYRILGQNRQARNATEALLDILRTFSEKNSRFLADLSVLVRTKRRNHIAPSREDVYPHKPELAEYTTQIVPGWWLGTNIANREKMRIIRKACDAQGVQIGKEIEIELPNAD